ncbi:golgi apparatus membrane protein TVP23, putative (TVP23) [Plasmodium ovale wallikeri]|uniref:Golgi apparatus membrane protein TVP23 homolog n=1 Tax=Plasmodium ovale wallikeri TaxID=864142 RepID=A0A1A8ZG49_PLAOA|nr:golgi apparatus membrane protein TVP23, putative (TVP23) [Plasmodium ovale wallikeri]
MSKSFYKQQNGQNGQNGQNSQKHPYGPNSELNTPNFSTSFENSMNIKTAHPFDQNLFSENDMVNYFSGFMKKSKHPYVWPVLFRNEQSRENDFIITFAITLFLVSLDFYLVKNITGRFLVKMIWWIDANDDYSNKIVFQSSEENILNKVDKKVFWYALYVNFFIWLMQTTQMLMSLQICWFMLCFLCLLLSFYNLHNFWKCSEEQHKAVGKVLNNVNLNLIYNKIFNGT